MDFYGLPIGSQDSDEFVRVDFGKRDPRFGLLTQASLLSRLAKVDPNVAGAPRQVRARAVLLHHASAPPPNIVVAPPTLDPRKTTRERFAQHREQAACAMCHELLDP
jgi:hypothetical protein